MFALKEGLCPLCSTVCTAKKSEEGHNSERESLLQSGLSLIVENKRNGIFDWSSLRAKWMSTCGQCFHLIVELIELDKLLKETETKFQEKLDWISQQLECVESTDQKSNNDIPLCGKTKCPTTHEAKIEVKSEPEDNDFDHWGDDNNGPVLDSINFDDCIFPDDPTITKLQGISNDMQRFELDEQDSSKLKPISTKRCRKRKVHYDSGVANVNIAPAKRQKSVRPGSQKSSDHIDEVHIIKKYKRGMEKFEDSYILKNLADGSNNLFPGRNKSTKSSTELRVTLVDFLNLIPLEIRQRLSPLVDCKFSVKTTSQSGKSSRKALKKDVQENSDHEDIYNDNTSMDKDFILGEISSGSSISSESDNDDWNLDEETKPKGNRKPKRIAPSTFPIVSIVGRCRRSRKSVLDPTHKIKVRKSEANPQTNRLKIPEIDFRSLTSLKVVNGRKFFLQYEFTEDSDGNLACGFPDCSFMVKTKYEDNDVDHCGMMNHIRGQHFDELSYLECTKSPQCDLCADCPLLTIQEYKKHMKEQHLILISSDDPKLFVISCPTCGHPFMTRPSFYLHNWLHYSDTEVEALIAQGFSNPRNRNRNRKFKKPGIYSCPQCPKTFKIKDGLRSHLFTHIDKKDRPKFLCDICGLEMTTKRGIVLHKMRHDPEQLKAMWKDCPVCDKKFLLLPGLNQHIARCHKSYDEREFVCEKCGKKFPTGKDLEHHMVSHNPPEWRPFKCPKCPEAYRYTQNLDRHVVSAHGVEHVIRKSYKSGLPIYAEEPSRPVQTCKQMFPCELCDGKVFELRSRLTKHLKTKHKLGLDRSKKNKDILVGSFIPGDLQDDDNDETADFRKMLSM